MAYAPNNGPPPAGFVQHHGLPMEQSHSSGYASNESSSKSPLNILGKMNPDKKQTKDGQPAKRRGPKPDSKPALTRRQELNRQAQRTHRERKEMYIKALEQEVLRLKEVFGSTTRERDQALEENRRLKELLAQHGITYDFSSPDIKFERQNSRYGVSSSGSISGSYPDSSLSSPPPLPGQQQQRQLQPQHHQQQMSHMPPPQRSMAQIPNNQLDYDQIGIDFVLTLERPCMDHMQYLVVRSHNPENQPFHHPAENPDDAEHEHMSGHALMATCPPHSHIMNTPAEKYPYQMPDLPKPDLSKLLELSSRLPFDSEGEITPIMAWTLIYRDQRLGLLGPRDFERIKEALGSRVRCYGFGAVLQEFELQDALELVMADKDAGPPALMPMMAQPQIAAAA